MEQRLQADRVDGAETRVKHKGKVTPFTPLHTEQSESPNKVRYLYLKKRPVYYQVPAAAPDAAHTAQVDESRLRGIVEELSLQLRALVAEKGFADQAVVELSQTLDVYIVQLQRMIRQKATASVQSN
ncbi:aspartyl-phosphate phosphatase Spo0E family protein [Brevibacillus marinus]|uniref:aspartyl-phosphate phosphatase Spo0E family protein n=1 Tax=Brevibacillus marinus TaxID=2496837 RepID=UPI000F8427DC|nr:aspartyl-phosphate phosphatase Spo0E family protein [Brevibacillus marinus]